MSGELPAMAPSSEELSGAELAARAGVGDEEIQRLVSHGVLVPRAGRGAPFRAVDVLKIRLARACEGGGRRGGAPPSRPPGPRKTRPARACEGGGLPMEGMAKAIGAGHLSFAFVES